MCTGSFKDSLVSSAMAPTNPVKMATTPSAPIAPFLSKGQQRLIDPIGTQTESIIGSQSQGTQNVLMAGGNQIEKKSKTLLGT